MSSSSSSSRRIRAFLRWLSSNNVSYSDALSLQDDPSTRSISVFSLCDLHDGDLVATIPKSACLTILTSAAREVIEQAGLGGCLGLAVAVMYERGLGEGSKWYEYFGVLPERECVPLVWEEEEVERFLGGTELDKTVKQDKEFLIEDWRESIEPLIGSGVLNLDPDWFSLENYFSAKTLVSSRAFEIDEFHGFGMVPLADLFNHKTGAENVHFTTVSDSDSDNEEDDNNDINNNNDNIDNNDNINNNDYNINNDDDDDDDEDVYSEDKSSVVDQNASSSDSENNQNALEMIIVRDVTAGNEVFNTYGSMGNAALLHRYGFTEPVNPFDLVNIELTLIMKWCSSKFTNRHARTRLSVFKQLNFSCLESQDSEYFEISYDGEPQFELIMLLYIIFLNENSFEKLSREIESLKNEDEVSCVMNVIKIGGGNCDLEKSRVENVNDLREFLLTKNVCEGLKCLADLREKLYGSGLLREDERRLRECDYLKERKLYDSLVLKISERKILGRLRDFATNCRSKSKKRRKVL